MPSAADVYDINGIMANVTNCTSRRDFEKSTFVIVGTLRTHHTSITQEEKKTGEQHLVLNGGQCEKFTLQLTV